MITIVRLTESASDDIIRSELDDALKQIEINGVVAFYYPFTASIIIDKENDVRYIDIDYKE